MTKLSTNSSLINTMTIFTDGSAQDNFGPTGSGLVNKNSGHHSLLNMPKLSLLVVQAMKVK